MLHTYFLLNNNKIKKSVQGESREIKRRKEKFGNKRIVSNFFSLIRFLLSEEIWKLDR